VRRTWAPRGQTPVVYQRTRCTDKLSGVGGLSISPRRKRIGLYLHWYRGGNITQDEIIAYLRDVLRHLRGRIILVWDRIQTHRSHAVYAFLARHPRLQIELLPPYAPELNPAEAVWSYLKYGRLANHGVFELDELGDRVESETRRLAGRRSLLQSLVASSELPILMNQRIRH
jgi:transposase